MVDYQFHGGQPGRVFAIGSQIIATILQIIPAVILSTLLYNRGNPAGI